MDPDLPGTRADKYVAEGIKQVTRVVGRATTVLRPSTAARVASSVTRSQQSAEIAPCRLMHLIMGQRGSNFSAYSPQPAGDQRSRPDITGQPEAAAEDSGWPVSYRRSWARRHPQNVSPTFQPRSTASRDEPAATGPPRHCIRRSRPCAARPRPARERIIPGEAAGEPACRPGYDDSTFLTWRSITV